MIVSGRQYDRRKSRLAFGCARLVEGAIPRRASKHAVHLCPQRKLSELFTCHRPPLLLASTVDSERPLY
jgi:hypothetical protein